MKSILLIGALAAYAATPLLYADPDWFNSTTQRGFKTNLPDFYQHQLWGDDANWEKNGGWCRETAIADCLYYWQVQGDQGQKYNNLLPAAVNQPTNWLAAANQGIKNIEASASVNAYLNAAGHGAMAGILPGQGLAFMQYSVDPATGKLSYTSSDGTVKQTKGNAFDVYKRELLAGQDVMLRLWTPPKADATTYDPSLWWSKPKGGGDPDKGYYHYVTGAGIDVTNRQIYFADPDSNKGSAKANAGNSWANPDAAVNARKYTAADVNPPVPTRGANLTDDPANISQYYGNWTMAADGMTITGGVEAPDRYTGVQINRVETICPTSGILFDGINPGNGKNTAVCSVTADPFATIDDILIFATASVDETITAMLTGQTGNASPWSVSYIDPSAAFLDPDGNHRLNGGLEFKLASGIGGLTAGQTLSASFGLTGLSNGLFDILEHVEGTSDWLTQAIGAPESTYPDQIIAVPEPLSIALLGTGALLLLLKRRPDDRTC